MNPSTALRQVEPEQFVASNDLAELAQFSGNNYDVLSFYFSLSSTPDGSHHEELVMVKDMVHEALRGKQRSTAVAQDLESLLETAEEIQKAPSRLRAVFTCKSRGFRREFDLPARGSVSYLNIGKSFHLAPLLRAMDSCLPYCVALIEHGKARAFVVRGSEIQEFAGRFPLRPTLLHADDTRVGWSHHIAGQRTAHDKAYFKELVPELHKFLSENGSLALVIASRDDLWGSLAPYVEGPEWTGKIIGRFDPPNFEAVPSTLLEASRPIFEQYQAQRYLNLVKHIDASTQCVFGLDEIAQALGQGRVHKLLLGKPAKEIILECMRCGHLQLVVDSCQFCGNPLMVANRAEEALIRRAVLTDAAIVLPPLGATYGRDGAAALLRF